MGQNVEAIISTMDIRSVRWGNELSLNGIGRNKKIKGVKRCVAADWNEFQLVVIMTIACVRNSRRLFFARCLKKLYCNI